MGLAISESFFRQGFNVIVMARDVSVVKGLEKEWRGVSQSSEFGSLAGYAVDAVDELAVVEIAAALQSKYASIDILVNNIGGVHRSRKFLDLEPTDWLESFNLNVLPMVIVSKAFFPALKNSKCARLINISSVTGLEPGEFSPHYSASKAATINFSKHLANAWAVYGITVNCIAAGSINSSALHGIMDNQALEESRSVEEVSEAVLSAIGRNIPLGRLGVPKDIANLVDYLVSPGADWITGATVTIDGGKHKGIF
tara:strand:- start:19737 stop:20501 length:765 start_codon:yes stop_codon:yes gene_type:complete